MSMDVTLILEIPAVSKDELMKELFCTESGDKLLNTLAFYSGKTIRVRINKRIPRPNSPDRERLPDTAKVEKQSAAAQAKEQKKAERGAKAIERAKARGDKQAAKEAARAAKKASKKTTPEPEPAPAPAKPTKKSHHNPAKGY